jgi:hypothetical protein
MRNVYLSFIMLLLSVALVSAYTVHEQVNTKTSIGNEIGTIVESPPPIDSICLVFSGIDYGGSSSSPQNYVNSKHIANVMVGSYHFPVVIWETGSSWKLQSLFSYWDDMFKFWSYPDSFTSNGNLDTGRPAVCADGHGNLHFCWHQDGSPDGYEIFYSRAILDTSAGMVMYNVERPAVMISTTDGAEADFPIMAIYEDTLIMIVCNNGPLQGEFGFGYNYSTDGGTTWAGFGEIYNHGAPLPCAPWILPSIGVDPNSGDMWAAWNWDYDGSNCADMVAYHWDAGTDTWTDELAAPAAPGAVHPFALPAVVVDYNSVPHIFFQENRINDGGASAQLQSFFASGPCGQLWYVHKQGASWSTAVKADIPFTIMQKNYVTGHASAGIATDNSIYFTTTAPESADPDTGAFGTFNINYAEVTPYSGQIVSYGKVSNIPGTSTVSAIFGHIYYNVPLGGEVPAGDQGPGITWCQLDGYTPPADCYYNHKDTLLGVAGVEDRAEGGLILYQNYPNPAYGKTMIRFTVPSNTPVSLTIYDIAGRLVRTLANGMPNGNSAFVIWDGTDAYGNSAPGGVYLYTLTAGKYSETKKLLLIQ